MTLIIWDEAPMINWLTFEAVDPKNGVMGLKNHL